MVSGGVKGSKAGSSGRFFICYQHHSLDAGPLLRTNTHCCLPSDLESLAKTGIVVTSASFHKHPTHGLTGAFRISGSLETTGTARTTTNQHVHRTGIWSSGASWGTPRPSTCRNPLFFQVRLVCFEHLRQQLFTSEHHSLELHLPEVSLDLAYGDYFSLPCDHPVAPLALGFRSTSMVSATGRSLVVSRADTRVPTKGHLSRPRERMQSREGSNSAERRVGNQRRRDTRQAAVSATTRGLASADEKQSPMLFPSPLTDVR